MTGEETIRVDTIATAKVPRSNAVDYQSPFPECRVLATVDPHALIRFDMNSEQAALLAKQTQNAIDHHDGDGLVTLGLTMNEDTYRMFANQVATLVEWSNQASSDETASAQVVIDRDLNSEDGDGISVSVIINEEQLQGIYDHSQKALRVSNGNPHRWEFSASRNGAEMLVQQLVAAVKGADDPLDHVNAEGGERDGSM